MIVQALANTAGPGVKKDPLASPEGVARWLARHRLLAAGSELGEDHRRRIVEARWAVRALLAANSGADLDPDAVPRLEAATAPARLRLTFDDGGPAGCVGAEQGFDDALGHLMAVIARARIEDRWQLFKLCARVDCRRAFWDFSQNHNARYCTRRCADRERTRAYRRRAKYQEQHRY